MVGVGERAAVLVGHPVLVVVGHKEASRPSRRCGVLDEQVCAAVLFDGCHLLTQQVQGGGDGPPLKVSETIIRNLRVLATDQRITSKDDEGKTQVKTFSNVTLEVTPRIAEKVAVAQSMGVLSLSLRSIADNTADLERAVAAGDIKVPANVNPAQERQMLLAYADRPMDSKP